MYQSADRPEAAGQPCGRAGRVFFWGRSAVLRLGLVLWAAATFRVLEPLVPATGIELLRSVLLLSLLWRSLTESPRGAWRGAAAGGVVCLLYAVGGWVSVGLPGGRLNLLHVCQGVTFAGAIGVGLWTMAVGCRLRGLGWVLFATAVAAASFPGAGECL